MNAQHMRTDERPRSQPATDVAVAMERVLDAEREASAGIEARRVECAARVAAARLQARALLERAEAIAQAIHARTDRVAEARARALAPLPDAPAAGPAEFAAAVARVAAWLTESADD